MSFIRKLHLQTDLCGKGDYLGPVHGMGWGTNHSTPQHLQDDGYAKAGTKTRPADEASREEPAEKKGQQTKRAAAEQKVEKLPLRVHGEVFATQSRGETFVVAPHT